MYDNDDTEEKMEGYPSLAELENSDNIVEMLDDDDVSAIGMEVLRGFDVDDRSLSDWKDTYREALEIAKQVKTTKTFPWTGASNIKFPLISQACIDFASRTMPQVIMNEDIVRASVVGADPTGLKAARAVRVCNTMSYQCLLQSDSWETDTDKSLQVLPLVGTVFKKTYYDQAAQMNCSELCLPEEVVVNYGVKSLESAPRITHIVNYYSNDIIERQRRGIFCDDPDLAKLTNDKEDSKDNNHKIEFLEQHCWYDLDGDGYKEPYIVTVHRKTGKVASIVHRFEKIERKNGKVVRITPCHYFTDYHFIHSPDGGFYSMGFGSLLLPLNKAIDSLINQLVDAGTLNNAPPVVVGRGARIRGGDMSFRPGEVKIAEASSGTDLKDQIFMWPSKEPSVTLYNLLGLLVQVGKDLTSNTDVLQGKQPAQNVANGTINTLLEQGTKMFSAINKRYYRSLTKEYRKLYYLNYMYLTDEEYTNILDEENLSVKDDFELKTLNIFPIADPQMSSETQKLQKAQMIAQLRTVNPQEADKYLLRAMQVPEALIETLIPKSNPNAPPPPEIQKIMAETQKLQAEVAKISVEATLAQTQLQLKALELQQAKMESDARIQESAARVVKMTKDAQHGDVKVAIAAAKMTSQEKLRVDQFAHQQQKDGLELNVQMQDSITKDKKVELDAATKLAKIKQEDAKDATGGE